MGCSTTLRYDPEMANEVIRKGLDELRALRGEVGQAVEQATGEAREGWKKLQPHLERAEQLAIEKAGGVAEELAGSANAMLADLRKRLGK